MGVFSGTLSYARYFVEGELPEDFRSFFIERIQQNAIPVLTLENEDEEVSGWACVENILDVEFNIENVFYQEYILLGFRIDRWKVPPTLLKAHLYQAEKEFKEENQRPEVTKRERTLLREQVTLKLKQQILPGIAVYDLCWQPDERILRFWSHSSRANERMIELFEKTFDMSLVLLSPYTWAERTSLNEEELELLAALESEPFVTE